MNYPMILGKWHAWCLTALLVVSAAVAQPQAVLETRPTDAPVPPDTQYLSLREALDVALRKNLGLVIRRYDPAFSLADITQAESVFDPRLTAASRAQESGSTVIRQSGVGGSNQSVNASQRANFGVSKRFSPGTEVSVDTSLRRSSTNTGNPLLDPDYASNVGLNLRQPLLSGFGAHINLAPIARAKAGLRASELEVRRTVLDLVAQTEIAYWNLARARQRQLLFLTNLEVARNLLRENRERERVGLITRIGILQAEAAVAEREEAVILARQAALNAEDDLLTILGLLYREEPGQLVIDPLPEAAIKLPDFQSSVQGALATDMDSLIQSERITQLQFDRDVAENRTRPDLDFVAGVGLLGRESDPLDAYESALQGRGYDWNVGLELSFPLGLRSEKARLRNSLNRINRAETQMAQIQQELLRRLRSAWRGLSSGLLRIQTTRASLLLNEESFERERARYDSGLSSFRDVLEAQSDFDDAKLRHLQAMFELKRADVQLARLDGRLLLRYGYTWDDLESTLLSTPEPVNALEAKPWPMPDSMDAIENPQNLFQDTPEFIR